MDQAGHPPYAQSVDAPPIVAPDTHEVAGYQLRPNEFAEYQVLRARGLTAQESLAKISRYFFNAKSR